MRPQKFILASAKPYQIELLIPSIQKLGFSIQTAETGSQALQLLHEGSPALILLDACLPDCQVLELVGRIRAKLNRLPIIILLWGNRELNPLEFLEAGADLCLDEPFQAAVFQARLKAILRRTSIEN